MWKIYGKDICKGFSIDLLQAIQDRMEKELFLVIERAALAVTRQYVMGRWRGGKRGVLLMMLKFTFELTSVKC